MVKAGNAVLAMEGVCLSFGEKRVLDGLTFAVSRGECFGFLGPSGAGKTTTIKLLTRQLRWTDSGRVSALRAPIDNAIRRRLRAHWRPARTLALSTSA